MVNKFFTYLGVFLVASFGITILWFLIEPAVNWTSYSEVRIYVRLFLVLMFVNVFSTLRLYNAIVQNTRFSIKLREVMMKFSQLIPGLERELRKLGNSVDSLKTPVDNLKKATEKNAEKLEEVSSDFKRKKDA